MNVTKLELINFRNYEKYKLENLKQKNIILGDNGTGKTSILESIYFGSITKTFKSSSDSVVIKKEKDFSVVKIELDINNKLKKLEVRITENGKKTKINGKLKKRLSDYISTYKVIIFSPDEIKVIKGTPQNRRNYINIQISQLNKYYITKLNNYNTLIKNKNEYLKKMYLNKNLDEIYLDIIDKKISELGFEICNYRNEYLNKINNYISNKMKKFKENSSLFIKYNSDFDGLDEEKIFRLLKKVRKKEIIMGVSSVGIHRDDFEFIYNNQNAKEFCSQGIQKLIILSMKLSENELLIKDYGIYPILLLDDLFSELDKTNQNKVLKNLSKQNQIFITTTDLNNIDKKIVNNSNILTLKD